MTEPAPVVIPAVPVLANATVVQLKAGAEPAWHVHVWGEPPHDQSRDYMIHAKTEDDAAFTGIKKFVDEMSGE